jgi:alpha,alpha-trehalase
MNYNQEIDKIKQALNYTYKGIIKPANKALKYDYLVPAGPYTEQWDWDAFFMAGALSSQGIKNAIFLKNWSLNYILNSQENGKVAGCITPEGDDPRLNQMKPLLAQGVLLASKYLQDWDWCKDYWGKIQKIVNYRFDHFWVEKYDLGVWYDSMESGADNNVASLNYPNKSVISVDFNTFMYRECKAMSQIADKVGLAKDSTWYTQKAEKIKENMLKYLWSEEDGIFWNLDISNGEYIKRISYSCFLPLWEDILSSHQAEKTIKNYLLNTDHLLSDYGIRTLSKQDIEYNNINMIKPHSNWQGPIWPIANYLHIQGLLNYGFTKEAIEICLKIHNLLLQDIQKSGGMHENYDAENGQPLAAQNFISCNILFDNCLNEIINNRQPFEI